MNKACQEKNFEEIEKLLNTVDITIVEKCLKIAARERDQEIFLSLSKRNVFGDNANARNAHYLFVFACAMEFFPCTNIPLEFIKKNEIRMDSLWQNEFIGMAASFGNLELMDTVIEKYPNAAISPKYIKDTILNGHVDAIKKLVNSNRQQVSFLSKQSSDQLCGNLNNFCEQFLLY